MTDAQLERLAFLGEELCEAGQVIGKILRHGYESHHPENPRQTNRDLLAMELGHVLHAIDRLVQAGELDFNCLQFACSEKADKGRRYLHHQDDQEFIPRYFTLRRAPCLPQS